MSADSRSFRNESLSRRKTASQAFTRLWLPVAAACLVFLAGIAMLAVRDQGLPPIASPAVTTAAEFGTPQPKLISSRDASTAYGKLPLSFEPNNGQTDQAVKFLSHGPGYTLFLTATDAVLSLQQNAPLANISDSPVQQSIEKAQPRDAKPKQFKNNVLHVQLVQPNHNAKVTGVQALSGKTNYLIGNDPSKWVTNISSYAKVQYRDILQGIDLIYYGNQGHLEYDFIVGAAADPSRIALNFRGARGLRIDQPTGDLVVNLGEDDVRFHKPIAYQSETGNQLSDGERRNRVEANYVLDAQNHVRFELGPYDHNQPLIIDPTLSYSTYLGGSNNDYGTAIAVDNAGNAYVTGYTISSNFPVTPGAFQTKCGGNCGTVINAFVSKLDPTGSSLIYSTYLGGNVKDYGNSIALDSAGDAYVVGQTFSANFPITSGAFQTQCGGLTCSGGDAFVTELDPSGSSLIYSTYLGGKGTNQGNAIVLDSSNNAYVTGYTKSLTFPITKGAYRTTCACSVHSDLFVTKLNSTGSGLLYSTYLGGSSTDVGYGIALDSSTNVYLTGYTSSSDYPTTVGAFQRTLPANQSAFITKLNSSGTALIYSTYLGGQTSNTTPCESCATDVVVDSLGDAYVCGLTAESNFPTTAGAFQRKFMSSSNGHDAFITELNPTGSALVFSTYLGGSGDDGATGIALDASGNVWAKGQTKSSDFPTTADAFQSTLAGSFDAYLAEFDPTGSSLLYSTYIGGTGTEYGGATRVLAVDNQVPPSVYITGFTNSTNFPTIPGSIQTRNGGINDAFVAKFGP